MKIEANPKFLQVLAEGRTSVFVAHRLSTIKNCDKVASGVLLMVSLASKARYAAVTHMPLGHTDELVIFSIDSNTLIYTGTRIKPSLILDNAIADCCDEWRDHRGGGQSR